MDDDDKILLRDEKIKGFKKKSNKNIPKENFFFIPEIATKKLDNF